MAAPAFIASASNSGVSNNPTLTIPTIGPGGSVATGQRALLVLTLTPSSPSADPTGWSPFDDTLDEPTPSSGRMYIWTATITSGGSVDPGDGISFLLGGSSRWTLSIYVAGASNVGTGPALGKYAPVPGINGNDPEFTLASPGATAPDECRAVHIYGNNQAAPNATPVTWTADDDTTERVDECSESTTSRNATILIADEVINAAGAVPGRTALSTQRVQPTAYTVLLIVDLDRPTVDAGDDQTVAAGDTFTLGASAADGAGGPYTYHWTQTAGTSTPLDDDDAQAPEGEAGATSEVLTYSVVATDSADTDSLPGTVNITIIGASDNAQPISDITTASWTKEPSGAPNFFGLLADVSDTSYAKIVNPTGAEPLENGLSIVNEPTGDEPYVMSIRCSIIEATSGPATLILKEGASTVIGSWAIEVDAADEVQQFDVTLTPTQVASIADFGDLRSRVVPGALS